MPPSPPSFLLGRWQAPDGLVFAFREGGAATVGDNPLTWSDDGAMLVLANAEGNAVFLYQARGDALLLLGDAGPLRLTRLPEVPEAPARAAATAADPAAPPPSAAPPADRPATVAGSRRGARSRRGPAR